MNRDQKRTLTLLTLSNIICQCSRYAIVYISVVPILHCFDKCKDEDFEPLCRDCSGGCHDCQSCRAEHDSKFYNMMDGACISTFQFGWLVGIAFGSIFSVFSLLAGKLVDVFSNRVINISTMIAWSVAMIAMSQSVNFTQVLLSRILLSAAQAFNMPVSINIISKKFNSDSLTVANGIYQSGGYIGVSLAALSLLLSYGIGWRNICILYGAMGLMLCLFISYFIPDTATDSSSSSSSSSSSYSKLKQEDENVLGASLISSSDIGLRKFKSFKLFFASLTLFSSLRFIAGISIAYYVPVYFSRQYLSSQDKSIIFVLVIAIAEGLAGSLSSYLGSRLIVYLHVSSHMSLVSASSIVTSVGALLAIPCIYFISFSSFAIACVLLVIEFLLAECWLGSIMSLIQVQLDVLHKMGITSSSHQGLASSLFLLVCTMVGYVGPTIIGSYDDGTANVWVPMVIVIVLSYLLSSVGFIGLALVYRFE